jgi:hypothetical protein
MSKRTAIAASLLWKRTGFAVCQDILSSRDIIYLPKDGFLAILTKFIYRCT